jgi:integrase
MVAWFADQHERWSPATIRVYAAALHQTVEFAMSAGDLGSDVGKAVLTRLSIERPRPRLTGPKRTSARKRRSCPLKEIGKVRAVLLGEGQTPGHPDDVVVAQLLFHNSLLGLRPCEWARAQVEGTHLIIQNAKATNGRACGTERTIELLGPYADHVVRANLISLIEAMRCRPATGIAGKHAMGRLSARLNRACQRAKITRISLYTLRHSALASAKQLMTTAEVAAFAGHAVDRTAGQHYAKRRSGWRLKQVPGRPSPDTVERVRITGKAHRPERSAGPSL